MQTRAGFAPDCVHELVHPTWPSVRNDERCKHAPVLRGQRDGAVVSDELDRSEHAYLCRSHPGSL